jgi:hypothetical protein
MQQPVQLTAGPTGATLLVWGVSVEDLLYGGAVQVSDLLADGVLSGLR